MRFVYATMHIQYYPRIFLAAPLCVYLMYTCSCPWSCSQLLMANARLCLILCLMPLPLPLPLTLKRRLSVAAFVTFN